MSDRAEELVQECKRQSDSCLYTSTALFIWLKCLRVTRTVFIVAPLVLGSLAGGRLVFAADAETVKMFSSICAFFAGLLPSIYSALKFDDKLRECTNLAAEFKNLQDRFRQAAMVTSQRSFPEFESHVSRLMDRLETARKPSITPPEWASKRAQKKVKSGDYDF